MRRTRSFLLGDPDGNSRFVHVVTRTAGQVFEVPDKESALAGWGEDDFIGRLAVFKDEMSTRLTLGDVEILGFGTPRTGRSLTEGSKTTSSSSPRIIPSRVEQGIQGHRRAADSAGCRIYAGRESAGGPTIATPAAAPPAPVKLGFCDGEGHCIRVRGRNVSHSA
jgi:hypothetical protein